MSEVSNEEKMAKLKEHPVKEEQVVEQATETTTESTTETQTETQKEEVKETQTETQKETQAEETEAVEFDLSTFNKTFGKEYENVDALNTLFEKADGFDKTKSDYESTKQQLDEYKSLAEQLDPMSYFASEDEYIRQQFLKNNELGEDAVKALSVLSPSRVNEMDGVDALKVNLMVNEGLTGEEAKHTS